MGTNVLGLQYSFITIVFLTHHWVHKDSMIWVSTTVSSPTTGFTKIPNHRRRSVPTTIRGGAVIWVLLEDEETEESKEGRRS
ncbi:hypothetical protein DVH24_033437 [Malus domestica]|uniref:Uncharacterized protein n=1 Tax=Malus domestica TaxID=3750 RepID=A0A498JGL3_MALDO|nr:hypothetical protein DVH24_033437 [Malus domestica]